MDSAAPSASTAPRRRQILRRLLVLGAVGMLLLAGTGLGVARLWTRTPWLELLAAMRWPELLASTGLVVVGAMAHGPRMRALLPTPAPGAKLPGRLSLGSLYLAATVLNLSFPGPAGELAAALVLRRTHQLPAPVVLATSLHGRFLSLFWACGISLLLLPLLTIPPALVGLTQLAAGVLAGSGLALGLLSLKPALLKGLAGATLGRLLALLPRLARPLGGLNRAVHSFADALGALPRKGPLAYGRASLWSLVGMASTYGALICAAATFGLSPDPLGALFTLCLTQVAGIALVLLPGGLGAFDVVMTSALVATAGLEAPQAGLVLLGVRVAQILALWVAGALFGFWAKDLLGADGLASLEQGQLVEGPGTTGA